MKQFDTIKKEVKYLSLSRKLVLFASGFTFLFLFFPWGTVGVQGEEYEFVAKSFTAFGVFPIFGWLLFIFLSVSLTLLVREMLTKKTNYHGVSNTLIWMFLGIAGAYTILMALFVLNSTYLKSFDSQFSLKVGVFLTLFMQALLIFAGYVGRKDEEKEYMKEALSKPHEVDTSRVHLEPEEADEDQMSLGDYDR